MAQCRFGSNPAIVSPRRGVRFTPSQRTLASKSYFFRVVPVAGIQPYCVNYRVVLCLGRLLPAVRKGEPGRRILRLPGPCGYRSLARRKFPLRPTSSTYYSCFSASAIAGRSTPCGSANTNIAEPLPSFRSAGAMASGVSSAENWVSLLLPVGTARYCLPLTM